MGRIFTRMPTAFKELTTASATTKKGGIGINSAQ
jgi:hypothetical protein